MTWLASLLACLGLGREAPAAGTALAPVPVPAAAGVPVHAVGDAFPAARPPVTAAQLRQLFPQLADPAGWAAALAPAMDRRGITSPARSAAFLAQVGHESAGLTRLVESFDYAADRLVLVFGTKRVTSAEAAILGRTARQAANQPGIANLVYGGAWGRENLGNTEPGDGWRFRGRGLIQITGRDNYTRCAAALGRPLDDLPAYLETPAGAAESATWWWQAHGCNELADAGDFAALTGRINAAALGLAERQALYVQAQAALMAA